MLFPTSIPAVRPRSFGRLLRAALLVGTTAAAATSAVGQTPATDSAAPIEAPKASPKSTPDDATNPAGVADDAAKTDAPEETDALATEQEAPQPDALLAPEAPPEIGSGLSDMLGPFLKSMLMLAVVVGLAYLTLHKGLGKLMTRAQAGKRVKVVERVSLDQRRSLYLVDIDGHEVVLAGGEGGVVHIATLPSDEEGGLKINHPPPKAGTKRTFKDVLQTPTGSRETEAKAERDDEQAS